MRTPLLFSILLSSSLFSQTTFAPAGAQWTYTQHHAFSADSGLFVIQNVGDTVIQGVACSVLENTIGSYSCMPFHRYVGTIGDSVVFWSSSAEAFRALYVFNQPAGFSWETLADYNSDLPNVDAITWTVLDTGGVVIDGEHLSTMHVNVEGMSATSPISSGTVWERMGDMNYMFPWVFGACDGEYNGPLRCYSDNAVSWRSPQVVQCDLITGVEETAAANSNWIWPTTVAQGSLFTVDAGATAQQLLVFDATGRVVHADRSAQGMRSIALNGPGMYVVVLRGSAQHIQRVQVF